jgi:hypothetical protein
MLDLICNILYEVINMKIEALILPSDWNIYYSLYVVKVFYTNTYLRNQQ